jgi:multiple sugar transport system permease protein
VLGAGADPRRAGQAALFVLPAALFVVSLVVFPLIFGLIIAFSDWNLSLPDGRSSTASTTSARCGRPVLLERAAQHGLVRAGDPRGIRHRLRPGAAAQRQIRARKFFRVAFLLPLMLSPVAVSWMIGKSMLEIRFGPLARRPRWLGWENPSFFGSPGWRG